VVDPAAAEAVWAIAKACPRHEDRLGGNVDVLVVDECVGALVEWLAVQADVAARCSRRACPSGTRNIDIPGTPLTSGFVTTITMKERRRPGVGGEELPAVDHPLVSRRARPGFLKSVGRLRMGLGH